MVSKTTYTQITYNSLDVDRNSRPSPSSPRNTSSIDVRATATAMTTGTATEAVEWSRLEVGEEGGSDEGRRWAIFVFI